jgi:hypothetical protein
VPIETEPLWLKAWLTSQLHMELVISVDIPTFFSSTPTFTMKGQYPEIQGGGSLILAWQVKNKNVLVIGGGDVSEIQSRSRV